MEHGVAGCLIAGGKSRRMGRDKRFLPLGGISLLDRSLHVLESLFDEVIVVLAEPIPGWNAGRHRVTYDAIQNCGSLGGLYTGLMEAASPRVFAVACDMPFLNADVIRYLVQLDPVADIVGAKLETGFQPMHGVYSKRCVPLLEEMARSGDFKIQRLFQHPRLNIRIVGETDLTGLDPALRSFQNINTPGEYEIAQNSLGDQSPDQ
jgi:molybdopterin-guanine dinucleotide biosynthesis protein A